jgi:phosphoribosylanthranilate isomerase
MFHIKICGITNTDDARAVAQAGADAVGLNFYPKSPRCVPATTARAIAEVLPPGIVKVGLFVNAELDVVRRTAGEVGLDLVQLHGDEPPEYLGELADAVSLPVMRAFRWGPAGLAPIVDYLGECRRLGCLPRLVLVDAYQPGVYGGSGTTADWPAVPAYATVPDLPPLVLAGGLTPENVAGAIAAVHPAAVDTASGVELSPGRKDAALVRAFVLAARAAMEDR